MTLLCGRIIALITLKLFFLNSFKLHHLLPSLNVHHHVLLLQPVDHVVHIESSIEDSVSEVGEHLSNF